MRYVRFLLIVFALPAFVGCYHYVPTPTLAHPQGTPLRANLSTMASFELAQVTVNNVDRVDGEMVRVEGGDVILSATWLQAVTGNGYQGNGWTVRIPESNLRSMEMKKVSWWRTGVVIGAFIAGTWLGFEALGVGPFGGDGGGPGGVQQ